MSEEVLVAVLNWLAIGGVVLSSIVCVLKGRWWVIPVTFVVGFGFFFFAMIAFFVGVTGGSTGWGFDLVGLVLLAAFLGAPLTGAVMVARRT